MRAQKFLHIRIPADFHQQLVKYAEDRFIPVSGVVLNAVAQTIAYKPQRATERSISTPVVPQPEPQLDEFGLAPDTDGATDLEWEDLQRRAAAAPSRPVGQ